MKDNKRKEQQNTKDSPGRSLAKAISWRLIASLTTFLITFVIFRQRISGPYREILEASGLVLLFDVIIKIGIYYLHERLWTNITWGKIWKRQYWKQEAWKRLYRKKHKKHP
ncbi:MAG: DUF2061 domain-containing protein [Chlorobi bacterium]|nr:DUF2061 domain-containing protein [Chlorobiota bacterium]